MTQTPKHKIAYRFLLIFRKMSFLIVCQSMIQICIWEFVFHVELWRLKQEKMLQKKKIMTYVPVGKRKPDRLRLC